MRRIATGLVVTALLAAACTSSGDDATTADDATDQTTTAPAPSDGATTTAGDGAAGPSTTAASVDENFASFRGVTADAIKVGITVPDFEALQAAGLSNYQGDNRIAYQVFIERINADGGIHGRMIEPVYVDFDLLLATDQDARCVELTEDEEVFIVLYGFIGENNACLTDVHDTMVMTHAYQTTAVRERALDVAWLQLEPADDEKARILASVVLDAGFLDGATVGVYANTTTGGEVAIAAVQQVLSDAGIESTSYLADAESTDPVAVEEQTRLFAERMTNDGIDFIFNLGGGGSLTADLAEQGFRVERMAHTVLNLDTEGEGDQSLLDGHLTVSSPAADAIWNDPEFRATCIDPILEDHPELEEELSFLPDADQQADGQRNWFTPVRNACNHTMLLKEIGEIAGADLTNESFLAALDELGPIDLHGYGTANFRSDGKWDGLDEFLLLEYDAATDTSVEVDAIVVDR